MAARLLLALATMLGLCTGAASAASLSPLQTIEAGGHARTFSYYRPDNFDPSKGMIVFLHGGGSDGRSAAAGGTDHLFTLLADRVGVLVLFPDGKPYTTDPSKHTWNDCNDGTRVGAPSFTDWDDVAFIRALIPWAQTAISARIDTTRVYAAGDSEGGQMAERLALEANDVIAAVADVAGNLAVSNDNSGHYKCKGYTAPWAAGTGQAVPLFLVKGERDPRIPFGYGHQDFCQIKDPNGPNPPCADGAVHSYRDTLAFWQWKLGLSPSPRRLVPASFSILYADTVPSCYSTLTACDDSTVLRQSYGDPPYPLVFLRIRNGGHPFPGPQPQTLDQLERDGWKNRDALGAAHPYVAEAMWAFFSQFTLAR